MTPQILTTIEERLWPAGSRRGAWMIVDAARDKRIFGLMLDCFYSSHSCLFSGTLAPVMQMAAPYLVQLEHDDARTRKFIENAWGNSWGIFLRCDTRLDRLRKHLRGFLRVRDPQGQPMLFRYYDPRVLRIYLPTCNQGELSTVFGPIEEFLLEDENPNELLSFRFDGRALNKEAASLRPESVSHRLR